MFKKIKNYNGFAVTSKNFKEIYHKSPYFEYCKKYCTKNRIIAKTYEDTYGYRIIFQIYLKHTQKFDFHWNEFEKSLRFLFFRISLEEIKYDHIEHKIYWDENQLFNSEDPKNINVTLEEFKNKINHIQIPNNFRRGQAIFNYIDETYGIAREIQFAYHIDCFYNDKKIDEFLNKAYEILIKKN